MRLSIRPKTALRSLAVIAAASLTAVGMTACSTGSSGSAGSATSGTITWEGWTPTDTTTAKRYIDAFEKQYPKIKVDYKLVNISDWVTALRPALASGKGPDVFDMQPGAYVTQFKGFAEDLTPVAKSALGADWKSKIAPIGISGLTASGKLTAMPVGSVYAGMLWINQGLFDKYSLKPPTTLAEWVKDCQVFRSHGQGCFVQGAAQEGFDQDTLQSIANSVQPGLWTKASKGEAKWNDPGIVKTLSIWGQMFSQGIMQSGAVGYQQYPDANNDFLTGKYAMVMMGTWYTQNTTKNAMTAALGSAGTSGAKPFTMLPIAFPDVAGAGSTSEMYGDADFGLAVSTKSQHRAAAETFVKWMTATKAGQEVVANQLNDIPSLNGVTPDFTKIALVDPSAQSQPVKDLIQKTSTVTEPREALLSTDVQNAILAAAQSVATNKSSAKAAADTLQQAAVAAGETFK